jgi:site-specific DNA-methyltransferase (adenine-specific)
MREEVIGNARLILGDSLDILPEIGRADHILTDPPFEEHMHISKAGARGLRTDGYASPRPLDFESITAIRDAITVKMSLACDGWIIAFCTPEGIAPWRDAYEAAGIKYKRACFWEKINGAPQFNGQGPAMGVECFVTGWNRTSHSEWNGGGQRNLFRHAVNNSERDGLHPTEKPVSLGRELVTLFSCPGELILDPFMGTGAFGLASLDMGRRFVGIERDEKYFDRACFRLERHVSQPKMFTESDLKQAKMEF